ncbi:MAG: hypothetical protein ABSC89_05010 [Verrucomicrobiota bacterium]
MAVELALLGSGSGDNCACIKTGETRVFMDAGFSQRQLRPRNR